MLPHKSKPRCLSLSEMFPEEWIQGVRSTLVDIKMRP
jgi:hypothetical protein